MPLWYEHNGRTEKFGICGDGVSTRGAYVRFIQLLVLKSERRTKATRSKIEARSAKRKSGGLFVPEAQDV
ncbi:hypothetical protein Hanom_Chr00s002804g01704861 [Helianthus anomalus]